MPKVSECCKMMVLALSRHDEGKAGLTRAISVGQRSVSHPLVIHFRKAKRGEVGEFGHGTEFVNATFSVVNYCPFCGKKQ